MIWLFLPEPTVWRHGDEKGGDRNQEHDPHPLCCRQVSLRLSLRASTTARANSGVLM